MSHKCLIPVAAQSLALRVLFHLKIAVNEHHADPSDFTGQPCARRAKPMAPVGRAHDGLDCFTYEELIGVSKM